MAIVGRASAIADLGWIRLSGLIGWLAWLFLHIAKLIGFRNRVVVLIEWAVAYMTYQRGARLITGDDAVRRGGSFTTDYEPPTTFHRPPSTLTHMYIT